MPRINWLDQDEIAAVEKQLEEVQQLFDQVGKTINGRVPARVIDRWLKTNRALYMLREDGVLEMRGKI